MPEIKRVRRLSDLSPNIRAVVNFPENILPARGYICDSSTQEYDSYINLVYGSVDNAIDYFINRTRTYTKYRGIFVIGFLFGTYGRNKSTKKEEDLFVYPWEISENHGTSNWSTPGIIRCEPHIIKCGQFMSWEIREKENFWPILNDELNHRKKHLNSFEEFRDSFPKLTGLEYID